MVHIKIDFKLNHVTLCVLFVKKFAIRKLKTFKWILTNVNKYRYGVINIVLCIWDEKNLRYIKKHSHWIKNNVGVMYVANVIYR